MTEPQFDEAIARLKGVYGERNYPDERMDLWFEKVREMPFAVFFGIVKSTIASHMGQAPSLDAMLEYGGKSVREWREDRKRLVEAAIAREPDCKWCKKSGVVEAVPHSPKNHNSCYFNCPYCEVSRIQGTGHLPKWGDRFTNVYRLKRDFAHEKGEVA